jgi:hypothetical protein
VAENGKRNSIHRLTFEFYVLIRLTLATKDENLAAQGACCQH